jgi:hypothetical protein
MKLFRRHKLCLIILLFLMSTTIALAQKRTQSEDDARQELDSLTGANKPQTSGRNAVNPDASAVETQSRLQKARAIEHHLPLRHAGHSLKHINWSRVKKQAAQVGVTAARVAQSSGFLPVLSRLPQQVPNVPPGPPTAPAPTSK